MFRHGGRSNIWGCHLVMLWTKYAPPPHVGIGLSDNLECPHFRQPCYCRLYSLEQRWYLKKSALHYVQIFKQNMGRVKSDDLNFTALSCCFQFFRETALPWGKAVPGSQAHCVSPQKLANLAPAKSAEAEYTERMFTNYSGSKLAFRKSRENNAVGNSFNFQAIQYHYCTLKNVLRFYRKSCQWISRALQNCWIIELDCLIILLTRVHDAKTAPHQNKPAKRPL